MFCDSAEQPSEAMVFSLAAGDRFAMVQGVTDWTHVRMKESP
ncbi:MAG: hypothetical protein OJF50_005259 [Nitrospira sp.]|jgi:hypothetical protein|nr:hypothetical protein [Nitrospira sp.]